MILQYSVIFSRKIFSYILQDFLFGIRIWIWAIENLRSCHRASVVLARKQEMNESKIPTRMLEVSCRGTKVQNWVL